MIRFFIGYDVKEPVAFSVFSHSIIRRSSIPVSITPVALSHVDWIFNRERAANQSTDFSFSRFLVPWLCGFKGWAIFADCDQLMLADPARLWNLRDERFAVQCVKHDHRPTAATKFLGAAQTSYPMKNWSSVMLLNCAKCWRLTPSYVNTASGLELHRFRWLGHNDADIESKIGAIDPGWNHLVGYNYPTGDELNLHFTEGGPWFKGYENEPFANVWRSERDAAFAAVQK